MYFESSYPLAHALIHFPYKIFLIWTSFCSTFIYYFDKILNAVANSLCMPCPEVQLDITVTEAHRLCHPLISAFIWHLIGDQDYQCLDLT